MPTAGEIEKIEEPYLTATILTPSDYTGTLMDLCQTRRGEMIKMEYLSPERLELVYRLAAGRSGDGLLRPDEVAHAGLCLARLRAGGLRRRRSRQGRRVVARRTRRRVLDDRAPQQGGRRTAGA